MSEEKSNSTPDSVGTHPENSGENYNPPEIPLTARERDLLRTYIQKRAAARRAIEEAEAFIEGLSLVIIERAGGDLNYVYTASLDITKLVPSKSEGVSVEQ